MTALRLSDRDVRRLAVAVADELERRAAAAQTAASGESDLSAGEVAKRLGVTVGFVYQHRQELGGFALGDELRCGCGGRFAGSAKATIAARARIRACIGAQNGRIGGVMIACDRCGIPDVASTWDGYCDGDLGPFFGADEAWICRSCITAAEELRVLFRLLDGFEAANERLTPAEYARRPLDSPIGLAYSAVLTRLLELQEEQERLEVTSGDAG